MPMLRWSLVRRPNVSEITQLFAVVTFVKQRGPDTKLCLEIVLEHSSLVLMMQVTNMSGSLFSLKILSLQQIIVSVAAK